MSATDTPSRVGKDPLAIHAQLAAKALHVAGGDTAKAVTILDRIVGFHPRRSEIEAAIMRRQHLASLAEARSTPNPSLS